jgi:hypothetical protein
MVLGLGLNHEVNNWNTCDIKENIIWMVINMDHYLVIKSWITLLNDFSRGKKSQSYVTSMKTVIQDLQFRC